MIKLILKDLQWHFEMNVNICPLKFSAEEPLVKLFFIGILLIFNLVLFNALGSKFKRQMKFYVGNVKITH